MDRIQRTANAVAKLDVLTALAQVAAENNYCRPVVDDSDELTITEGRHPVVEQVLKGSLFVPNDTTLNCGEDRCLIPSPKVATYDLQPEMSAPEVAEKLVAALGEKKFDLSA